MTYWNQMFIDWNRRKRLFHDDPALFKKCKVEAFSALSVVRFHRSL
jgi:hypothetical protein